MMVSYLQVVGVPLPYDDLNAMRQRLTEVAPHLTRYGSAEDSNYFAQAAELSKVEYFGIYG